MLIRHIYDDDDDYYERCKMSSFLELQPIKTMWFNKSDSRFILSAPSNFQLALVQTTESERNVFFFAISYNVGANRSDMGVQRPCKLHIHTHQFTHTHTNSPRSVQQLEFNRESPRIDWTKPTMTKIYAINTYNKKEVKDITSTHIEKLIFLRLSSNTYQMRVVVICN